MDDQGAARRRLNTNYIVHCFDALRVHPRWIHEHLSPQFGGCIGFGARPLQCPRAIVDFDGAAHIPTKEDIRMLSQVILKPCHGLGAYRLMLYQR
jgi:hypothetical protein